MKKLLSSMTLITTIASQISQVVACSTIKYSDYPAIENYVSSREQVTDEEQLKDAILRDYQAKKDNNNVAAYFVKRNGAFIALQSLLSSLNVVETKKVYFNISQNINDNDANGINYIAYQQLDEIIDNFNFSKSNDNKGYIDSDDLEKIVLENPNSKIDLYIEDFQLFEALNNKTSLTEELYDYWDKIDSLTFTTDGTGHFNFEIKTQMWLNQQTDKYLRELTQMWEEILKGNISKIEKKYYPDLDKILPTLLIKNSSNEYNFVSSWVGSSRPYADSLYLPHSWNEQGTGLKSAYKNIASKDGINYFDIAYKMDEINKEKYQGKENIIFTGNLLKENPAVLNNQAKLLAELHNENIEANIIFKAHPREDESYYDKLKESIKQISNNEEEEVNWLIFERKETPIEVFAITDTYFSDENTKFEYIITGASTTVQTLYESKVSDSVRNFIFNSEEEIEYYKTIYGDQGIIDFQKAKIQ